MTLLATAVFTPNDIPTHTYIRREGEDLEKRLRAALVTPNSVISLSGPSKSGKTVLMGKAVDPDNLIKISGPEIRKGDDLWDKVLDWMDVPQSIAGQSTEATTHQTGGDANAKVNIPLVAEVGGKVGHTVTQQTTSSTTTTTTRQGLAQVEKEIAGSGFVVFIDDFHYMDRAIQTDVAKQIKVAAEKGIRMCVASVPHRSDDIVRSNPELRGRTAHIDTTFWTTEELAQIAVRGFDALNVEIAPEGALQPASEACGSPQLMQQICLQACFRLDVEEKKAIRIKMAISSEDLKHILWQASTHTDYTALVRAMHQGPKTRGVERKVHHFSDGTNGDVYRAVLLSIASNPPKLIVSYQDLISRVSEVCAGDAPAPSSIVGAIKQDEHFALTMHSDQRIIEWDPNVGAETLSIVDPYFLFYLRASKKLLELGQDRT